MSKVINQDIADAMDELLEFGEEYFPTFIDMALPTPGSLESIVSAQFDVCALLDAHGVHLDGYRRGLRAAGDGADDMLAAYKLTGCDTLPWECGFNLESDAADVVAEMGLECAERGQMIIQDSLDMQFLLTDFYRMDEYEACLMLKELQARLESVDSAMREAGWEL